ncbi:MAG: hypothetical protein ACRD4Y_16050, partial [Candidatus Acidiferrales bacterium]
ERLPSLLRAEEKPDSGAEDAAILAVLLEQSSTEAPRIAGNSDGGAERAPSLWKRDARLEQIDRDPRTRR